MRNLGSGLNRNMRFLSVFFLFLGSTLLAEEVKTVSPTAVDLPGPNGVMMPNFTFAGIPGGIPAVEVVAKVDDFGAAPDDGESDNDAIEAAIAHAVEQGGGAVLFGEGVYHLSRPVTVISDGIVLRGQGKEKTHLSYSYGLPVGGMRLVRPSPGDVVKGSDFLEGHINTKRMKRYSLYVNDEELFSRGPDYSTGGDRFWIKVLPDRFKDRIPQGPAKVRLVVEYWDGTVKETSAEVEFDLSRPRVPGETRDVNNPASIQFVGDGHSKKGGEFKLVQDALRGSRTLELNRETDYQAGDLLVIRTPPSKEFLERTQSRRKDLWRRQMVLVERAEGKTVTLQAPLRLDFTARENTQVFARVPIRRSGLEDLTLEHTEKQWINGISFFMSHECWVKGVRMKKSGRNPLTLGFCKNFQAEDSEFLEAWYLGGGGTGYVGVSGTWDTLMQGIVCKGLRHAPVVQASAGGNVIRDSDFYSSDINYHMLWPFENLIENCTLDAKMGTGSYGYALFTQKPEVSIHGPGGGPRSVIWNNRFTSPKSGVYMGGSNEGWVIAYNQFEVEKGPGMILRRNTSDMSIYGNTVTMDDPSQPMVMIETADCRNVRIWDNQTNATQVFAGKGEPTMDQGNLVGVATPTKLDPPAPSILEWQKKLVGK